MPISHTDRIAMMKRSPIRVTITLPFGTHQAIEERSMREGRSLSNLCAFLLEQALLSNPLYPDPNRLTKQSDQFRVAL